MLQLHVFMFFFLLFQDVNPSAAYNTTTYEIQNNLNGIEMHMTETNDTPHFHALDMPVTTTIGNNLSPSSKYLISSLNTNAEIGKTGKYQLKNIFIYKNFLSNLK